jgi:hypothetical protein
MIIITAGELNLILSKDWKEEQMNICKTFGQLELMPELKLFLE